MRQTRRLVSLLVLGTVLGHSSTAAACPDVPAAGPQVKPVGTRTAGPTGLGPLTAGGGGVAATIGDRVVSVNGGTLNVGLPADRKSGGNVAVDDAGNVYVAKLFSVVKLNSAGLQVWSRSVDGPLRGIFLIGSGSSTRVGAAFRDRPASQTWRPDGQAAGEIGVYGDYFTRAESGQVVATDRGRYVRVFAADGSLTRTVGHSSSDNDASPAAAPAHFYQLGGAALLPDGRLLVADTQRGIMLFAEDGVLLGSIAPGTLDAEGLTQLAGPVVRDGQVYVATGLRFSSSQSVKKYPLTSVIAAASEGQAAEDPRLGIGAGLTVNASHGYVPAGQPIDIRAVFDPSWENAARTLQLCYAIATADQLRAQTRPSPTWLPLGPLVGAAGGAALALPDVRGPGAYQIDARLVRDGRAVATTTRIFTVGAPGQRLDFASLPPGADFGGPTPARGVVLADQLGTDTHRVQLDWRFLLPTGVDGPLDLSRYRQSLADAHAEASRRGVTLEVQVADGSPIDKALVANGTWERRVGQVVSGLKDSVDVWEAWNEPNGTYGSATSYVRDVLAPFRRAVKAADPTSAVIGGSTLGVSLGYWSELIRAGGLQHLDVAGVHPYTGHNRSWEEDGTIEQLTRLKAMLVKDGRPIPIWNTEHAWWSDGPFNLLAQGDNSSRAMLWMRALEIERWAYFIPEGGFGNDGVTFSAIESNNYVKPAALALMTTSAQLRGRPFLGRLDVGAPSAYAMRFGPRAGDASSGELLVAWTDGLELPAAVTPDAAGRTVDRTEELGATSRWTLPGAMAVKLDSSPIFFALRGAGRLEIASRESFGDNLAAAGAGTKATASSALASNPPQAAIDGDSGAAGGSEVESLPVWAATRDDAAPVLTLSLGSPTTISRILLATHSLGSVVTGLRDYDIEVQAAPGGPWITVRQMRGQFQHRHALVVIPAQTVAALRIRALAYNFSGYFNGAKPPWWPVGDDGRAIVAEVGAYAPGSVVPVVEPALVPEGSPSQDGPVRALPTTTTPPTAKALARVTGLAAVPPTLTKALLLSAKRYKRTERVALKTARSAREAELTRRGLKAQAARDGSAAQRDRTIDSGTATATAKAQAAGVRRSATAAKRARRKADAALSEYWKATARFVRLYNRAVSYAEGRGGR